MMEQPVPVPKCKSEWGDFDKFSCDLEDGHSTKRRHRSSGEGWSMTWTDKSAEAYKLY
jgi:hypothetical protein